MQVPIEFWIGFNLFVLVMLAIDLLVLHRDNKTTNIKESLLSSAVWIALALIFNLGIYFFWGKEQALNFLAGYLIEESLSVDNLFIFILIFKYFQTPPQVQYKVLFWGIIGAVVMRAFFIYFGITLIHSFHWILYIFGAFLIYTGFKMALSSNEAVHPEDNPILKLLKKYFNFTNTYEGDKFFVKRFNRWWATTLFAVLLVIETTDIIFALDSIPAVMAITLDSFIIYTSNIFAILGLRSLYFSLSGLMSLFHFLHYSVAAILIFVGLKMILEPFITINIVWALSFIVVSLGTAIVASLIFPQNKTPSST